MRRIWYLCAVILWPSSVLAEQPYSFGQAQAFLKTYCQNCHSGATAAGGFRLERIADLASLERQTGKWQAAIVRVRNG